MSAKSKSAGGVARKGAPKRKPTPSARKKNQRNSLWTAPLCLIMLGILGAVGWYMYGEYQNYARFTAMRASVEHTTFYQGISIDGIEVGGMTLEETMSKFASRERELADRVSIALKYGDKRWVLAAEDLNYKTNYSSVVRRAYQVGRSGTLEERYNQVSGISSGGAAYSISRGYEKDVLREEIDKIADQLSYDAKDASIASFNINSRTFSFTEAQPGASVDADQLYARAVKAIDSGEGGQTIEISPTTINPVQTVGSLSGRYGQIAQAVTNASSSSSNRLTNIRLALSKINGTRLDPGKTFSFNNTVGERTAAKGYKSAGAFADGLLTEEVGGGICQVSTTLFNAAVKANLEIVSRSPHSRPVTYVDKGKDAAVSWPGPDLAFTNDSSEAVYIVAYLSENNRVNVEFYGRTLDNGMYIRIEAQTTQTLNPGKDKVTVNTSLAPGARVVIESARNGYKAVAYKIYYDRNGEEIKREELCRSTYSSSGAVIQVGP